MQKILVVDHYDSFVYNVIRMLEESGDCEVHKVFSDELDISILHHYRGLVLSPGPGLPAEAKGFTRCLKHASETHKILGICLGHQAILEFFGGQIEKMPVIRHGHKAQLHLADPGNTLLKDVPQHCMVGLYNSWTASKNYIPDCLGISATDSEGNIMAVYHKTLQIFGIQFHPESVVSGCGDALFRNFLAIGE